MRHLRCSVRSSCTEPRAAFRQRRHQHQPLLGPAQERRRLLLLGSAEASASIWLLASPILSIGMSHQIPSRMQRSFSRGFFICRRAAPGVEAFLFPRLDHRIEQVQLGRKVGIEAADAGAGELRDVEQRGAVIAALGKQVARRIQDGVANRFLLDLNHGRFSSSKSVSSSAHARRRSWQAPRAFSGCETNPHAAQYDGIAGPRKFAAARPGIRHR